MPADVVGLANLAVGNDPQQRPGVIFDIEPIAYLGAVAINGARFTGKGTEDQCAESVFPGNDRGRSCWSSW